MNNELYHFNPNHDKMGRFAKSSGGGSIGRKLSTKMADRNERRDFKKADKAARKQRAKDLVKRRTLSDADLKKKVERLKTEKEYKELTETNLNPGKSFVKKALSAGTQKALTTAIAGAELYIIKAALTKTFKTNELGDAMFYGGAKKK